MGALLMYPNSIVKNQFGEEANNFLLGGSNQIDFNFIVDHANGNGLGIRSLKGSPLIKNVFMYTSATPATGNPFGQAASEGSLLVELSPLFQGFIAGFSGPVSPLSGTPINVTSGLTIGKQYVIVSVGTTTAAQWQALGLPVGVTPNVGAAFVATSASAGVGTGVVEVPLSTGSGYDHIEVVGDPNQTCNVAAPSAFGAYILSQFWLANAVVQPADNTVVGLRLSYLSQTAEEVI
jgi:hypothetical protein